MTSARPGLKAYADMIMAMPEMVEWIEAARTSRKKSRSLRSNIRQRSLVLPAGRAHASGRPCITLYQERAGRSGDRTPAAPTNKRPIRNSQLRANASMSFLRVAVKSPQAKTAGAILA